VRRIGSRQQEIAMNAVISRILVPTDFSETADQALEYARMLGDHVGASLHVLHVVQEPLLAEGVIAEARAPAARSLHDEDLDAARASLDSRSAGTASADCAVGDTVTNIVSYASRVGADLIVMGTTGRTGIAHLLLGSVAEHVVRTAPCPVVTVRHQAI
jgi:nucleotide-binding universal stress UspA family protein